MSQYVWRGIQISDDSMAYSLRLRPHTVRYPQTCGQTTIYPQMSITETDYTLSYARSIDKVSLDVGAIYYAFGPGVGDTAEVLCKRRLRHFLEPERYILSGCR